MFGEKSGLMKAFAYSKDVFEGTIMFPSYNTSGN